MSSRRTYPCDISDAQWREIDCLLPFDHATGRKRTTDLREVVNAINYRWHTGCTWRMLPHDYPPWGTIYAYFRRWQRDGTLKDLREAILRKPPRQSDRSMQGNSLGTASGEVPPISRDGLRASSNPRNSRWKLDRPRSSNEPPDDKANSPVAA